MTAWRREGAALVSCVLLAAAGLPAQDSSSVRSPRPKSGAQFLLPVGSVLLPGLGQYVYGAALAGGAYTATALAGVWVADAANPDVLARGGLPRTGRDQLAFESLHVAFTAGALSGWDAFRRGVPALQGEGKYEFLGAGDDLGGLLAAPFDPAFLSRWTTWVNLGYAAVLAGIVVSQRDAGRRYETFRARDAAFVTALSLNAGVGEEALFRGWLLPLFRQNTGDFWAANVLQSVLFGALHVPDAEEFAVVIGAWAIYEGWLTRRNDWSIRESIFHHFWYDVLVGAATLLADERGLPLRLRFPGLRF